jgi:hypothetical protein
MYVVQFVQINVFFRSINEGIRFDRKKRISKRPNGFRCSISFFLFWYFAKKKQSVSSGAELCPVQICSQPEPEKVEASSQSAKISSVEASLKPAM